MSYKYTIIIPHKNIPQLLKRCLDSIPGRDDIQVIVVDDASEHPQEIESVVNKYENVDLILTTEKKGAGYARNRGLEQAKGEWLLFADADDLFSDDLSELIDKHYADNADIVYFAADSVFSESLKHSPKLDNRRMRIEKYQSNPRKIDKFCRYFHTEPWAKMIRRELVEREQIRFDETPLANDFYFSVVSAYYARNIVFDNHVFYIYTEREGSLSFKYSSDEKTLLTRLEVYLRVQDFFDSHQIHFAPFYRYSFSEYINNNGVYSDVIKNFWKSKRTNVSYVIYRYIKSKLYQYMTGVY